MHRYFFEIAYHGKNYHGWQIQGNAISVQEVVEEALTTISREDTSIVGSGRTDTGVHCRQQFFHADMKEGQDTSHLKHRLNSFLPDDIAINGIREVKPGAHARFDALLREYKYYIMLGKSPFYTEFAYYFPKKLNAQTMNEAASLLVGSFDFQAFSKVKTQVNNFICDVHRAHWEEHNDKLVFTVSANRFLRGMVRAIVGTLIDVGTEKIPVAEVEKIRLSGNRRKAGPAVPARGLFLNRVVYPEEIFI